MRAGRLRHRVTIQSRTLTQAADGEPVETWSTVASVWAEVLEIRGREYLASREEHAEITTKITIRYRAGIVPSMRVVHGSDNYDILHVVDVQGRKRMLELMCRRVVE